MSVIFKMVNCKYKMKYQQKSQGDYFFFWGGGHPVRSSGDVVSWFDRCHGSRSSICSSVDDGRVQSWRRN